MPEDMSEMRSLIFFLTGASKKLMDGGEEFLKKSAQQQEILTTVTAELTHSLKSFKAEHEALRASLETLETILKKQMEENIQVSLKKAVETLGTALIESVEVQLQEILQKLAVSTDRAVNSLTVYEAEKKTSLRVGILRSLGIALLAATLSAGLIRYFFPPPAKNQLIAGEILQHAWGHLTEQEQKKILKASGGNYAYQEDNVK